MFKNFFREVVWVTLEIEGQSSEKEVMAYFEYIPAEHGGREYPSSPSTARLVSLEYEWRDSTQTVQELELLPLLDQTVIRVLEENWKKRHETGEKA